MRAKSIVLIMIASGCGLIASIGISQVMERGANRGGGNLLETEQIFVAMADIDIGEELTAENVRLEEWPRDKVPEGVIRTLEDLEGQYPRTRLYPGEPILQAKLMDSNGDVDSLKIPEGYRAVSIKVTLDSSVSGLIQPGDRVDIVAFLRKGNDIPKTMARTILRDVRVFAVNSETERSTDASGNSILAKTVSVLVKHTQVEPLMLAHDLGQLRLSLRRPNDMGEDSGSGVADIDSLLGTPPEVADEQDPPSAAEPASSGGFLDWLQTQQEQQPPPALTTAQPGDAANAFEMCVLTPDGPIIYRWQDEGQLPQQVTPGVGGALASPTLPPTGAPTSLGDQGGDLPGDDAADDDAADDDSAADDSAADDSAADDSAEN